MTGSIVIFSLAHALIPSKTHTKEITGEVKNLFYVIKKYFKHILLLILTTANLVLLICLHKVEQELIF